MRRDVQAANHARLGNAWADSGLIFTTRKGRPVEPRHLVRSCARICDSCRRYGQTQPYLSRQYLINITNVGSELLCELTAAGRLP